MNQEYYDGIIEKNNSYHNKIASKQYMSGDEYSNQIKVI